MPKKKVTVQLQTRTSQFFIAHRNVTAFFFFLTRTLACASIFISFYVFFLSGRLSVRLGASIGRLPPSENKDPTQLLGYGTEGGETRTDGFFFFSLPLLLLSVSLKRGGESLLAT